ncbi:MAG: SBBP repeat-containing protein [Bacteroidetes bacterium]|nr:SBBP repeat-containing protein [Bacteroidota bacterium]
MKNQIITLILFIGLFHISYSQPICHQFEKTINAGGTGNDIAHKITLDKDGNTYMIGAFTSPIAYFGNKSVSNTGNFDVFIAKFDNDGNCKWVTKAGGKLEDIGNGIAVDGNGNSFVTGYFRDTAIFGSTTLISKGDEDIFIAKLDSLGNFVWAKQLGSKKSDIGLKISSDPEGNSFIVGRFMDTISLGSKTYISNGNSDALFAKINSSGNFIWVETVGGIGSDNAEDIVMDEEGNNYAIGTVVGTVSFGNILLNQTGSHFFISKFDSLGNFLWVRTNDSGLVISSSNTSSSSISLDSESNCYISGTYVGKIRFGSFSYSGYGNFDIFIIKMDSSGNPIWVNRAGGIKRDRAFGVATNSRGESYIAGSFEENSIFDSLSLSSGPNNYNIFIAKLDASGKFLWARQAGSNITIDEARSLTSDSVGNCFVTGSFSNTVTVDDTTITTFGSYDAFIIKISDQYVRLSPISDTTIHCGNTIHLTPSAKFETSAKWTPSLGVSIDTVLNPEFSPKETTTYTLTLKDKCNFSVSEQVTISVQYEVTTQDINICQGDSLIMGSNVYKVAGTYTDTVSNIIGCDSIVITNLSIVVDSSLNNVVVVDANSLTASESGNVSYQWIDCDNNNSPISGETNRIFSPSTTGNYAVIITSKDCPGISTTSDCVHFEHSTIQNNPVNSFLVYPNPSSSIVSISGNVLILSVRVISHFGQTVLQHRVDSNYTDINMSTFANGFYTVLIETTQGTVSKKVALIK